MVDSHLMLSAMKIWHEIRCNKDPERQAEDAAMRSRNISAPCSGCKIAGRRQGGTTKGIGHDHSETPAIYRSRRKPRLPGAAASRHRRLPAHDRAAVCRPRKIDPRARGGHEE